MKKFLLTTVAAGALVAGSAFAEGPTVTLGGFLDFQVGNGSQDSNFELESNTFNRSTHTRTDTEIHINVDGKTDSGLGYGAYIELEADVNAEPANGDNGYSNNSERSYLYVESAYGRVEVGPNTSASEALKVDASSFARATGGIAGDFYNYVDLDGAGTAGTRDVFIVTPDLPTSGFPGTVEGTNPGASIAALNERLANANKITYYTPRIYGVQGGLSFTPDLQERGTAVGFSGDTGSTPSLANVFDTSNNASAQENVWNAGINYQGQYDNIGINLAATGEIGESEVSTNEDLAAWQLGGSVNYAGFTVGGSYALIDEVGSVVPNGANNPSVDGNFWTVGGAYEYGPFGVSVTYLDSTLDNASNIGATGGTASADFQNISVGADYQLAPGLVPYVEVSFFETDDNTSNTDNDGTVFIVGSELNF